MHSISRSTVIEKPIGRVFSVITNPARISTMFPGVENIQGVKLPLKRGSSFRWEYVFLGMRFRGLWTVDELTAPTTYIGTTSGSVISRSTYSLAPDQGNTRLSFELDFETPTSLLRGFAVSLIEPHMAGLIQTYLKTLKHFIEHRS